MNTPKPIKFFLLILGSIGCLGLSFFFGTKFSDKQTEPRQSSADTSEKIKESAHPALPDPTLGVVQNSDTRIETKEDGTHVLWIRSNNGELITQYHFAANGSLSFQVLHRTDAQGSIMGSRFYDSNKIEMFNIRCGYSRSDNVLVEERIFDSRTKHLDDNNKETPVCRLIYMDVSGNRKKTPICIQLIRMELPTELKSGVRNPFLIDGEE